MKKYLILIACALLLACNVSAQSTVFTMTRSGDTVVNTANKVCSLKVARTYRSTSIQVVVTKVSGTVAGTVTMQGSLDGVTWVTLDTACMATEGPATFVTTNVASQSKVFLINSSPYYWYRASYTGSGTMAAIISAFILPREQQ